jgi:rhodanese-related sulfurtransferase
MEKIKRLFLYLIISKYLDMFKFLSYNASKLKKGATMEFIKEIYPENMKNIKVNIEKFLELYNNGKCVLVDVREPYEVAVWQLNFGLKIPARELPENLDKLPKDKIIITACPGKERSNCSAMYLRSKGFDARYLEDGLLGLMGYLKSSKAKEIKIGE